MRFVSALVALFFLSACNKPHPPSATPARDADRARPVERSAPSASRVAETPPVVLTAAPTDALAPSTRPPASQPREKGAQQGMPCDGDIGCTGEATCLFYYGAAGPIGPRFSSCEFPCSMAGVKCPAGQTCTTISDGPGRVCRPRE